MGTWAHVIVNGGPPGLAAAARRRVEDLEARWSRFRADSELSRLNDSGGEAVEVSEATLMLVRRGVQGWHRTGGLFDPTVLGDLLRAGYDRDFRDLPGAGSGGRSGLRRDCAGISIRGRTVRLPRGTGFDSGGLGKGLAADLVAHEVVAAGASGVCVNLGGDLRVIGPAPGGGAWTLAVEHPRADGPMALVGLVDGGVATSTTLLRRWTAGGQERHHLIDPATGRPSAGRVELVSVVARQAWLAEVTAKAVILTDAADPFTVLAGSGCDAMAVLEDGETITSDGFARYLGIAAPDFVPRDSERIPSRSQRPAEAGPRSSFP